MTNQFTTAILVIACSLVPLVILAFFLIHAHERRQTLPATVLARKCDQNNFVRQSEGKSWRA